VDKGDQIQALIKCNNDDNAATVVKP